MPENRIDIDVLFREIDGGAISGLRAKMREITAEAARLQSTTFDPFSRMQAARAAAELNLVKQGLLDLEAGLRVEQATVGAGRLQEFINASQGLDRTAKSASSSARVLGASLGTLAAEDSRARDARVAHAQAIKDATERQADAQRQADAKMRASMVETDAAYAASRVSRRTQAATERQEDPAQAARKVQELRALIDDFGKSPAQNSQLLTGLNAQLRLAEGNLQRIQRAMVASFRPPDGWTPEAVGRMREAFQALNTTQEQNAQIARAGAQASYTALRSTKDVVDQMAGTYRASATSAEAFYGRELNEKAISAAQRQKELQAAFGPVIAAQDAMREREAASLAPFRALTAEMRNRASATQTATRAIKENNEEADKGAYAARKLITVFDETSRGQRGQLMSTVGSIFRDMGAGPVGAVGGLGAVVGIAATARMAEWQHQLAELAVHQENMAAATGMGAQEFITFSTAVELAGGKADTAGRSLEALQKRMLEAVLEPTGQAGQAFVRLGITWEELRKRLADPAGVRETLMELADVFVRVRNSAAGIATFNQLAGGTRQLAEIVPILKNGSAGFTELEAKADALNPALHRSHDELVKMDERVKALDASWQGFKASVVGGEGMFSTFTEAITDALKAFQIYQFTRDSTIAKFLQQNAGIDLASPKPGVSAEIPGAAIQDPLQKLKTVSDDIVKGMQEATSALPRGYSVRVTGGHADTGHAPDSEHKSDTGAVDYTIFDAQGRALTHAMAHANEEVLKVYRDYEYKFKAVTPSARAGVDFDDPGHVDQGLLHGKAPGRMEAANEAVARKDGTEGRKVEVDLARRAVDFDEQSAEKRYMAGLQVAEQAAKALNDNQKAAAILAETKRFESLGPTERAAEMTKAFGDLGKAQLQAQTQVIGVEEKQWQLQKQITEQGMAAAKAEIDKKIAVAEGEGNHQKIFDLRKQEAALIASDVYAQPAKKLEEEAKTLRANNALQREKLGLLSEQAQAVSRANDSLLKGFESQMSSRVDRREMTPQQGLGFDIQEVERLASKTREVLDNEMKQADAMKNAEAQTRTYWKEWELGVRTQEKVLELTKKIEDENKKAAEATGRAWKTFFDGVGSQFETYIEAAVTKSETFQKATQTLIRGLAKDLVKFLGDLGSQYLAKQLAGTLGESIKPGEGLGALAGNFIGRQLGLTAGDTAAKAGTDAIAGGAASKAAADMTALSAATVASTAAKTGETTATVTNTAGKTLNTTAFALDTGAVQSNAAAQSAGAASGGIGGFIKSIPIIGGLFAQGGIVPSAAGGMVVPGGALAGGGQISILHPREMVLPAHLSTGLQGMIDRGGGGANGGNSTTFNYNANVTGYHPYGSRSSFESMLRQHGGSLQAWTQNMLRNGAFG